MYKHKKWGPLEIFINKRNAYYVVNDKNNKLYTNSVNIPKFQHT